MIPTLLTYPEVAKVLRISVNAVKRLVESERLQAVRYPGIADNRAMKVVILESEILDFLERNQTGK
ncbi:helix-turn-helix domain-containing protein [bacterium]|nr:helix-turn-helix domain-containing protein [bacterium]